MNISPEAWNTQDTIQGINEAQEEGRTKYAYFCPSLNGNKIPTGGDTKFGPKSVALLGVMIILEYLWLS